VNKIATEVNAELEFKDRCVKAKKNVEAVKNLPAEVLETDYILVIADKILVTRYTM
jgi:hypothetical protein